MVYSAVEAIRTAIYKIRYTTAKSRLCVTDILYYVLLLIATLAAEGLVAQE